MKFGTYIKMCRERYELTQEELVNHLYMHDDLFIKLDVVTLSRWEREVTRPNFERQRKLIQAFRKFSDDIFPGHALLDAAHILQQTTQLGITKIVGKHKRYILDFPKDLININNITISDMKTTSYFESSLKLTYQLHKKITNNVSNLTQNHFKIWASHPKSFFLLANYDEHFFGMLFSLSLTQEAFNRLLAREMKESDIQEEHFAKEGEKEYVYPLGFFAYSEESATQLLLAHYHYLVSHQHTIDEVGILVKIEEGHKLAKELGLHPSTDMSTLPVSYRAKIEDTLLNDNALSIVFEKFKPKNK